MDGKMPLFLEVEDFPHYPSRENTLLLIFVVLPAGLIICVQRYCGKKVHVTYYVEPTMLNNIIVSSYTYSIISTYFCFMLWKGYPKFGRTEYFLKTLFWQFLKRLSLLSSLDRYHTPCG